MTDYKPSTDFSTRLKDARDWRKPIEPLIEEIYAFCAPDRRHEFNQKSKTPLESDVFHSLGEECAGDLAGDLITYFTPAEARWFSSIITVEGNLPAEVEKNIKKIVEDREREIEDIFNGSNYNDMSPQWAFEAATHGTAAMWIQQAHMQQPIFFEVVPPSELLITPGHLGYLDRFREKPAHARTLPALFAAEIQKGEVYLDEPMLAEKIKKGTATCKIIWGFWLDWTDPATPQWRMEITVDGKCVTKGPEKETSVIIGDIAGSCPLVVGRFNPRPNMPWGRGPGFKTLPDMRVLDKVDETVLLGLEDAITNTLIYPDDGFLDMSEGIAIGTAIPAHRGFTRDQIYELNKTTNLEVGFFTEESLERKIRAGYYQDGPRQRGDTPPTAAQWFDEARRVQQRIGKPSAPLWTELVYPMVQRVEYLGIQAGRLPEQEVALDGQSVSIKPISPLQKAQNRDQVMIARSNIDLATQTVGPEGVAQVYNLAQTFAAIIEASGDTLTVIATQEPQNGQPPQAPPPADPPV